MLESPVGTDEWENDEITRYEYDLDDLLTSRITEYWESSNWQDSLIYGRIYDEFGNMLREEQLYYEGSEMADWYYDYAVDYFWVEEALTGLIEMENLEISCFPNPAQDYLNIIYSGQHEYSIYDLKGKLIYSGQFVSSERISLNDYPSGVYILSLDNGKSVKRIFKEK